MKKILLLFLVSFAFLFLFSTMVYANGLVPCGIGAPGEPGWRRCELSDLFKLVLNVYNFIVINISTPLAGLLIVIGGIVLTISGGNPRLASLGKNMLWWTVIGILLIWGSWLIVDIVLKAIGYAPPSGQWWKF